ncbi:MAG: xanthine dehydrogenase molybdopterin binding subunit [Hyphomicrobiales bacterium]
MSDVISGGVHTSREHDSAHKHVSGDATYIDDIPETRGTLHVYVAQSPIAHGRVVSMDLSAVRTSKGVACVLTAGDIPGENDASPVFGDDPVFAEQEVIYAGQSVFAVAADTLANARRAADEAEIEYEELPAILSIDEAMAQKHFLFEPETYRIGDADKGLADAKHRLQGTLTLGGQDHFYLEGHIAYAIPGEDGDMFVWSSTQHPSEVQHNVAKVLGVPDNAVNVQVRRMGGAFGGKESQPALFAAIAALAANATGKPAKLRLDRDDDMIMTGKRHDFKIAYDVGFGDDGRICGITFEQMSRFGCSSDLSTAVSDRALCHADNAYFLENARITSHRCHTHTVSNTAFRGFGGPQGMAGIERVIDHIAHHLGRDALDVRCINYYGSEGRDLTPYHMKVEDNILAEITDELVEISGYHDRRAAVDSFNAENKILKKGLALTPVKFGISFNATHLNQAGALVHVYKDGSVHLNHGGTEMGQGLFTKIAQVVAEEFQIDVEHVKITATTTGKVPNTSATAASSGSDLNGMAAQAATRTIKQRLIAFAAETHNVAEDQVVFKPNRVLIGNEEMAFKDLVMAAYMARISLSSTGFYKTPKLHWDASTNQGRPFFYFSYGVALSEVVIDTLTGENKVCAVDILNDCGQSLNPAIDLGQIEGGFIQGMGWLTTEELWWDDSGALKTHAPSTYKIPCASDRPDHFNISIWEKGRNVEDTIYRSKAVGEPPLMLALSVLSALSDAVSAASDHKVFPHLDAPATPERILEAVERVTSKKPDEVHT